MPGSVPNIYNIVRKMQPIIDNFREQLDEVQKKNQKPNFADFTFKKATGMGMNMPCRKLSNGMYLGLRYQILKSEIKEKDKILKTQINSIQIQKHITWESFILFLRMQIAVQIMYLNEAFVDTKIPFQRLPSPDIQAHKDWLSFLHWTSQAKYVPLVLLFAPHEAYVQALCHRILRDKRMNKNQKARRMLEEIVVFRANATPQYHQSVTRKSPVWKAITNPTYTGQVMAMRYLTNTNSPERIKDKRTVNRHVRSVYTASKEFLKRYVDKYSRHKNLRDPGSASARITRANKNVKEIMAERSAQFGHLAARLWENIVFQKTRGQKKVTWPILTYEISKYNGIGPTGIKELICSIVLADRFANRGSSKIWNIEGDPMIPCGDGADVMVRRLIKSKEMKLDTSSTVECRINNVSKMTEIADNIIRTNSDNIKLLWKDLSCLLKLLERLNIRYDKTPKDWMNSINLQVQACEYRRFTNFK